MIILVNNQNCIEQNYKHPVIFTIAILICYPFKYLLLHGSFKFFQIYYRLERWAQALLNPMA